MHAKLNAFFKYYQLLKLFKYIDGLMSKETLLEYQNKN